MDSIFKLKAFTPFILVAFINAFTDLGHKIIIQNTIYKIYDGSTLTILSAITNALILLPFIMLFTPSGFIADKYPKNIIMRYCALLAVILTIVITYAYYQGYFYLAFIATFLMAIQSALYSPAKYGYIRDLLGKDLLALGNGAMQACAIVAILSGMTVFSLLFELLFEQKLSHSEDLTTSSILQSIAPLGFILIACSILELILSYRLPTKTPTRNINFDTKAYIKGHSLISNLSLVKKHKIIWLSIIGITLFWSISQLMLATFPTYVKEQFNELNTFKVQIVIASSAIGIIIGSYIAAIFSKRYIETGLIPLGACLICLMDYLILSFDSLSPYALVFFFFGLGGSLFSIPLNALIQYHAKEEELGKILACNNFIQNIGMLSFLIIATIASFYAIDVRYLFYFCMICASFGAFYVIKLLPFSLTRILVTLGFFQRYRINVEGFDNIPQQGGVLLLGNHISFIDWAMVQLAIPRKVYFVMDSNIYNKWYLKIFLRYFGVIPISPRSTKKAFLDIEQKLKEGEVVCLFPEGCISRHGHLNTFKKGYEYATKNLNTNDAVILPFYLRGLWGSAFSRGHKAFKQRRKSFAKRHVTIAFAQPLDIHSNAALVKSKVFELSFIAWKSHCQNLTTISRAFINSCKKYRSNIAIVDSMTGSLSYLKMLTLSLILKKQILKTTQKQQNIGIMLPASSAAALVNMATLLADKTVVNLNFTASTLAINEAIAQANIKYIYTSSKFLQKLQRKGIQLEFKDDIKLIYVEDMIKEIKLKKLTYLLTRLEVLLVPEFLLKLIHSKSCNNNQVAAILFSSGSEGKPKGIMLSHLNILSNISQISDVIQAYDDEKILSSLPPFHAFGLTVTTFMPLLEGILSVTHADPSDAVGIAKVIARHRVTIMCATSTFLGIYARHKKLDKVMFDSLRLVVAGAEKLRTDVKEAFVLKFKKEIYEGYGATETTPVACVNLPSSLDIDSFEVHKASKDNSVGMPLPGSAIKIVDPDTMAELLPNEDGLILIGGHQVMLGYLNNEQKTKDVIVNIDGIRWYKSYDKGHLDEDGFLHIVDRYSRFAKIGGEMVSLGAIEEHISSILKDEPLLENIRYCALAIDDSKKGQQVILLVEGNEQCCETIESHLQQNNTVSVAKISKIVACNNIPVLGSGKIDYQGAKTLALELLNLS